MLVGGPDDVRIYGYDSCTDRTTISTRASCVQWGDLNASACVCVILCVFTLLASEWVGEPSPSDALHWSSMRL